MEDPESEWKIQEYSSSKEDEADTMVKRILKNGYGIGRKIAITGIVISTAPLVVPPLVVFSAMGVAFSVPFGLFFAGYACTNKLMNMLLPTTPSSPLMLEYYADECEQENEDQYGPEVEGYYGDAEVNEQMDGINHGVQTEIMFKLDDGIAGDDQGYEEDDVEYLDDRLEEEPKGDRPLVESQVDEKKDDYLVSESGSDIAFGDAKDVATTKTIAVKEIDSQKLAEIGSKDKSNIGSDEEVPKGSVGTHEITGGNASKDGSEDALLRTVEEHFIHSNEDLAKISDDKSDLDLLDERNTNSNFENLEGGDEGKENAGDVNMDVLARSPDEGAPLDTENAKDTYMKMPSREEDLDEEKMWEKMRAMRRIVGYKGASEATCMGELKALYVFTGVEPPASLKGDWDLDEVNAKLKFLMAIVGVK